MKRTMPSKAFSAFISVVLVVAFAFPTTALAAQPEVQVENHTVAGAQTVSKLSVDGVDAPEIGKPLDDKATVTTAEGATWDIPVLWIGDDLQLATEAVEGRSYLPVLAFFVPQDYTVEGNSFTVAFSKSLSKLFGDEDAISVFDARSGITYILPISLRDFFAPNFAPVFTPTFAPAAVADVSSEPEENSAVIESSDGGNHPALSNVEIWCAQTARDVLTDEDLEYLIDLVLHTLEPQAVNLLINSFPSFKAAASQNLIGKEIGLYIYYKAGDKDGKPEHELTSSALAYVSGDSVMMNGELKYCYMIGIDVDDLLVKVDDDPVRNASTGKFMLDRKGEGMITFNNTIVHELFHAFMDDYNRTGMLGAKNVVDGYTPGGKFSSDAQEKLYNAVHYPYWFVEGTASAVENVYQFRYNTFKKLFPAEDGDNPLTDDERSKALVNNYVYAKDDGKWLYFELEYADNPKVETAQSRYVSGYLATLYLAQLAAQKDDSIGSAINNQGALSSSRLRLGLDSILRRMHDGETLDQVIRDISTLSDGATPLYADTDDFEKKFIKGLPVDESLPEDQRTYRGDYTSLQFMNYFIKYMQALENTPGRQYKPNGSILFDFDQDFNIPLDDSKQYESDFYIIITSNERVESTVPDSAAFASGGKSDPPKTSASTYQAAAAKADAELPLAAKAATDTAESNSASSESMGTSARLSVDEVSNEPVAEFENELAADSEPGNDEPTPNSTVADGSSEPAVSAGPQQDASTDESPTPSNEH